MPPKRFRPPRGQHFLRSRRILARIAARLPIHEGARVIEIGAGDGALTAELLARGAQVTAIEVEPRLAARLRERFAENPRLEVLEGDILELDLAQLVAQRTSEPALVTGNLPYYITSPILRRVFAAAPRIAHAVFLMQHEVALRVAATKGSRDYGFLSVLCRLYSEPEYLFAVPPGAFRPPPKVQSAVVRLTIRPAETVDPSLVAFLKACFRQPRKTLRNNLAARYPRTALDTLEECTRRAQQLDLDELRSLWQRLESMPGAPEATAEPAP